MKKLAVVCAILGLCLALAPSGAMDAPPPPPPPITLTPTRAAKTPTPGLVKPQVYRVLLFPAYKDYVPVP